MYSIERAAQCYRTVNLAGRVNDGWCTPKPWVLSGSQRMSRAVANLKDITGPTNRVRPTHVVTLIRDVARYNVGRMQMGIGIVAQVNREIAPVQGLFLPNTWSSMYGVVDVLVGRGHSIDNPTVPTGEAPAGQRRLSFMAQHHGLLGMLVEALPARLATACERRGFNAAAATCMLGASLGRLALQPLRLSVCAWSLVHAATWSAIIVFAQSIVQGLAWVMIAAAQRYGGEEVDGSQFAKRWYKIFSFFDPQLWLARTLLPEEFPMHFDPNMPQQTNGQAIIYVSQQLTHVGRTFETMTDAQICAAVDAIVVKLRRYCADLPNDDAFRGGLRIIQDFMDSGVVDCHWRPTPDHEAQRVAKSLMRCLQGRYLTDGEACAAADDIVEMLRRHFLEEPSDKAVRSAEAFVQASMLADHPAAQWQPVPPAGQLDDSALELAS